MSFNPNGNSVKVFEREVSLELTWKAITGGSEIQGKLRFRGKEFEASAKLDRTCRGSDVGSLVEGLFAGAYRTVAIEDPDAEKIIRSVMSQIRRKLVDDFGIT